MKKWLNESKFYLTQIPKSTHKDHYWRYKKCCF